MSRVGFFGDVHGEFDALVWGLEALGEADQILCTGDIVDGPRDSDCIRLLRERGVMVLRGNHDQWAGLDLRMLKPYSAEEQEWLLGLPLETSGNGWLAYHSRYEVGSTEQSIHWDYLLDPASVLRALLENPAQLIVCGHTHIPAVNVLADGVLEHLPTDQLRQSPVLAIEPGKRYVVNVGQPTRCVVLLDTVQARVEYRFREQPAPPRKPSFWTRLTQRLVSPRRPKGGEWPAF